MNLIGNMSKAMKSVTYIRKVPDLNLGRDTDFAEDFCGFLSL
jgi:hypothetical protein